MAPSPICMAAAILVLPNNLHCLKSPQIQLTSTSVHKYKKLEHTNFSCTNFYEKFKIFFVFVFSSPLGSLHRELIRGAHHPLYITIDKTLVIWPNMFDFLI